MATICDACGTKYGHDAGYANLRVTPARVDFRLLSTLMAAGQSFTSPDPLAIDLCLACTAKTLASLGLPTAVCEPPPTPPAPTTDAEPDRPNAGALTTEDLRQLGLTDPAEPGDVPKI